MRESVPEETGEDCRMAVSEQLQPVITAAIIITAMTRLQRLDHLVILHLMHSRNDRAELYASGGLHDHVVASLYLKLQRIEEIYLARCTKSYTNYFCHIYLPH